MVTLKDIANEAGVSIMTVSNVINGKFSKVSEKNITNIQRIVQKYNYIPNSAARSLSSRNSRIIALFVPDGEYENPHYVGAFNSIAHEIYDRNYYLMVFSNINPEENLSNLKTWNVDGVICFPPLNNEAFNFFINTGIPTCFIDSYQEAPNILKVGLDDFRGGYLAGNYLAKNGHSEVGFASYHTDFDYILKMRLDGFKKALEDNGLILKKENIYVANTTFEGGIDVANQLIDKNSSITGILATEDQMAIGIMEGARQNGISVPAQLSVIGFDNIPLCEYVTPKLTTISQDITQKGKYAAEMLLNLLEKGVVENKNIKMPLRIVERQSVIHR